MEDAFIYGNHCIAKIGDLHMHAVQDLIIIGQHLYIVVLLFVGQQIHLYIYILN